MEELKLKIREQRPTIKQSSINNYINALKKLNNMKSFNNLNFIKNYTATIRNLNNLKSSKSGELLSDSSKKLILASILVALKTEDDFQDKLYEKYNEYYHNFIVKYNKKLSENKKSQRQSDNWISTDEINDVLNHYIKKIRKYKIGKKEKTTLNKREKFILQAYLVAGLYILQEPRRNVYATIEIITFDEYKNMSLKELDNKNFLVIKSRNNKFFSFGDHKSKRTFGIQKIPLSSKLNSVVNLWLKYNSDKKHLLYNINGEKMTKNGLTKFIQKVFKVSGKTNISSTMLRHIYVSENTSLKEYKKMKNVAEAMGHSIRIAQEVYNVSDD